MKYEAVIETNDYKDFEFFEDGSGKYIHGIDAGAVNNEWIALYFKECNQESILDKIRAEIEQKIEQEEFARSVFRHEEKDTVKAEQCTGSIMAYNNVIKLIDKYTAESEVKPNETDI